MRKILYVDMDNVLVDFQSAFPSIDPRLLEEYKDHMDDVPGIFSRMKPMEDAVEAFGLLADRYDAYILSTAPWNNPTAWSDKLLWVREYLGEKAKKRLILTHHKGLNSGDYLIDDRTKSGADRFKGELILFGSERFQNWRTVLEYLLPNG